MRFGLRGLILLAFAALLPAAYAEAPRKAGPANQDVLLLGDRSPTLLRLHVQIDGQPLPAAWERYLDKLFADLDRDNDGVLNKAEAARAPSAAFLQSYLQASLNLEAAADAVPFNLVDTDGDGRIASASWPPTTKPAASIACAWCSCPSRATRPRSPTRFFACSIATVTASCPRRSCKRRPYNNWRGVGCAFI